MPETLLIHPKTQRQLQQHLQAGSHALLLVGPVGSGKASLAQQTAGKPAYTLQLRRDKTDSIPIAAVRQIEHFLSRRIPPTEQRTIIIEDAQTLSIEAQNALLKMLEEPPLDTRFILTADAETSVLPTIRSRTMTLHLLPPSSQDLQDHFLAAGFEAAAIKRAELMSGGLPGLMYTLLTAAEEHPLVQAAAMARSCMQAGTFERICLVEPLSKNRQLSLDTLWMLQQMAHVSLAGGNTNPIWKLVLEQAYTARQQLLQNAQPKLVLTNLMLKLAV